MPLLRVGVVSLEDEVLGLAVSRLLPFSALAPGLRPRGELDVWCPLVLPPSLEFRLDFRDSILAPVSLVIS